jgi:hypothetical protein
MWRAAVWGRVWVRAEVTGERKRRMVLVVLLGPW